MNDHDMSDPSAATTHAVDLGTLTLEGSGGEMGLQMGTLLVMPVYLQIHAELGPMDGIKFATGLIGATISLVQQLCGSATAAIAIESVRQTMSKMAPADAQAPLH